MVLQRATAARTTTLSAMARPLGHRRAVRDAGLPRLLTTSMLAVLLAAGAHLAAGGAVPRTSEVLLGSVGLAGANAWLACKIGQRTRGLSPAVALVSIGQGSLELLLWFSGHGVRDALLAAGLHAAAALVLVVLALGIERVAADLRAVADRSLPLLYWSKGPEPAARCGPVEVNGRDADPTDASWWPELCPVRGPPLAL